MPGKHVFGLAVISGAGGPPTLLQCLICGSPRDLEAPLGGRRCLLSMRICMVSADGGMLARAYVMPARDLVFFRAAVLEEC